MQPHQKYYATQYWLFVAYTDERWLYYQFTLPHLYISLVGRMYFLSLGVYGLTHMPFDQLTLTEAKQAAASLNSGHQFDICLCTILKQQTVSLFNLGLDLVSTMISLSKSIRVNRVGRQKEPLDASPKFALGKYLTLGQLIMALICQPNQSHSCIDTDRSRSK